MGPGNLIPGPIFTLAAPAYAFGTVIVPSMIFALRGSNRSLMSSMNPPVVALLSGALLNR